MNTKKDYIRAARLLQGVSNDASLTKGEVIDLFVQFFAGEDSRFQARKFREAARAESNAPNTVWERLARETT